MRSELKLEDIETEENLKDVESILTQLRKKAIYERKVNPDKNQEAWNKLMTLSDQISKEWKNGSAVEEIKSQRRK
jgi:hypothetical protein